MEEKGWTFDQFKLTPLQPPAMPQALVGGAVDATVIWEPWGYNAIKQLGDNGVVLRRPDLYYYRSIIIAREDFIQQNPEVTKGVLRALLKAEKFALSHKEEAIAILVKNLKLDAQYLSERWNLYEFKVQLSQELLNLLDRDARMIIKYTPDFKDKLKPDFRPFILDQYLRELEPSRVSLHE